LRWFHRNRAIIAVFGLIMLASGVADHALHLDNHFARLERLAKKAAASAHAPGARASDYPYCPAAGYR
jgi:hypothetical protein